MDLEATKYFKGPRGSLLRVGALIFFAVASVLLLGSLTMREAASFDFRAGVSGPFNSYTPTPNRPGSRI